MLFNLLDKTCKKIGKLNVEREAPKMLREISRARPDWNERLKDGNISDDVVELLSNAMAQGVLVQIKTLPTIAEVMVDKINTRQTDPALRCALVGVLAYLVQPHDLIPDDAPGGYGFVDDNVLLRAGLIEYLNLLPPEASEVEKQRDYLSMFGSIVPLEILPAMEASVIGITSAFHILRSLPAEILEMTTEVTIQNPLQATSLDSQPRFRQPTTPNFNDGRWSGGCYFEGGNVIMPGGPSIIDGELFIPDY